MKMKQTLSHTQLGANAYKVGGWENAMAIAEAVESGNYPEARRLITQYPQASAMLERIIEVRSKRR